jgi:hypothetical protein
MSSERDADDRPTLVPEFDPEDFARDSEIRQRAVPEAGGEPTIDQAHRLHLDGDHEQALFLVTRLLELAPPHAEATKLAAECRVGLERQCLSAIGSEASVLIAAVSPEELKGFALDNVSAFLFSRLDGATSLEEILDVAGVPRLLALRHLRNLLERGIISLASGQKRSPLPEDAGVRPSRQERVEDDDSSTVESRVLDSRPGPPKLDAVPVLLVAQEDLDGLNLDRLARAFVALVDDKTTVEEILATTKTDVVDGTVLLERLAEDGIIAFV